MKTLTEETTIGTVKKIDDYLQKKRDLPKGTQWKILQFFLMECHLDLGDSVTFDQLELAAGPKLAKEIIEHFQPAEQPVAA